MSLEIIGRKYGTQTIDTLDFVIYSIIGGIIGGFIVDYTRLPTIITLTLGIILMGLDLGAKGVVADILEGIGFALTSLGAYELLKNKLTITAS